MIKIIGLLFFIMLFSGTIFCQKTKTEFYSVKYIKPPKSELTIAKNYSWTVTELTYGPNFRKTETKYSAGQTNYGRGQFFADRSNLGSVPGFQPPQKGIKFNVDLEVIESSIIELIIGTVEIVELIPIAGGKLNSSEAGSSASNAYNVRLHVPLSFEMQYAEKPENGNENSNVKNVHFEQLYYLNEEALSFNHIYQFPKDFKAFKNIPGYSTKAELDQKFNKNKRGFLKEMKDRIIAAFLKKSKLEVESLYCSAKRNLDVRLNYIKDKEGNFPGLEEWTNEFKKVESLLKANIEANNKMNWFTPEIKIIVKDLLSKHLSYLQDSSLPLLVKTTTEYNLAWFYFFNADFDQAINQIDELLTLKEALKEKLIISNSEKNKSLRMSKEARKATTATIGMISVEKLNKLKEIINDFKIRYIINKEKLNW